MWIDILSVAFITSLLSGMIRVSTPILYGSLGLVVTNRAGILNLGVEGAMLMGAFAGFMFSFVTGSLFIGVIMAAICGGILGLLMVFLSVTLKVNQVVAGLSINLLSTGITLYLYRIIFADFSSILPNIKISKALKIPFLTNIPFIGDMMFGQQLMTYIAILLVPAVYFFLYKTKYGLILRGIGENPAAVDMKGVNIGAYRYGATIFGSMMAGIGGAFLSVASSGMFMHGMTRGRGWIVIALVNFGDWKPTRIMLFCFLFGLLDSFSMMVQGIGIDFPYQFFLALPYLVTILGITLNRKRSGAPLAMGVPYSRDN